jgi:hypothetical protein
MRKTTAIITVLLTALSLMPGAGSLAGETQKKEANKGLTVDDLAHGLKSAEQNIEKEIPKIGSAIGETVKKLTGKGSDKQSDQKPSKKDK